jgi:putative zinc finger/helix-turn-helix YgiT family protein
MENSQATITGTAIAQECALCGAKAATHSIQTQQFAYREGTKETLLVAEIPVTSCASCGETFTAEGAEEAQHDAVCRYLGRLTPDEIRALRERNGLTQQKMAELTGIGIASIKRWEAGNMIQNASLDQQMRALDQKEYRAPKPKQTPRFQTEFREESLVSSRRFKLRPAYAEAVAA